MSEFYHLIEGEIPRLRRYARALTRSTDRADDLVQETLMRTIAESHLWQTGTDIRAWLYNHAQSIFQYGATGEPRGEERRYRAAAI